MAEKRKSTIKPGLDNASFFARVPMAQGLLGESFAKRHPYLAAHEAFVRGWITREQAVAHILSDREFMAEAELGYLTRGSAPPLDQARAVVHDVWVPELVAFARIGEELARLISKHGGTLDSDGETVAFPSCDALAAFSREWMKPEGEG